ncbi:MAG TPA: ABC transporter permease [Candidatus Angelobacter sp.]|nr:ABC transporter permease [Candidatus Angelobacter sp.]
MQSWAKLSSLFRNLLRRKAAERELDAEINFYIEEQAERKVSRGIERVEALRQARVEAGGAQQIKEEVLAARAGFWLETFWRDIRYAARALRKKPLFTVACVLTFAVGIGANTAIFSMVNGLVLRPVHAYRPDQLTFLVARLGTGWMPGFSLPDFLDIREQSREAFSDIAGVQQVQHEGLNFQQHSQMIWVDYVSSNFFPLMGVKPALGSFFADQGKLNSDQPAMVLNYSYWKAQFNGDPGIVGKTAFINGQPVTIVGVAEEGFHGAASLINTQGFIPLGMAERLQRDTNARTLQDRDHQRLLLVARLKDGVDMKKADSVLAVVSRRLSAQYPDSHKGLLIYAAKLGITNSTGENPMPMISALFLTLAALVLLLAAGNVMNLLLVQAALRTREMAVRSALGAARWRLIRQALTETGLMVFLGVLGGIAIGAAAAHALGTMRVLGDFPILFDFSMDWRVFAYASFLGAAVAITAGLTPAWRGSSIHPIEALREGGRQTSARRQRLRTVLVISQLAGSLTLLIVAGLFIRSLRNAERRDLGFDASRVMDFTLDPHGAGYDMTRGQGFYDQLLRQAQTLPGVERAALAQAAPLDPENNGAELEVDGVKLEEGHRPQADYDTVSPEFLNTLHIQLVRGRDFSVSDNESAPRVAIINELMAEHLWPGKDPVGRQFKRLDDPGHVMTVVGVMRNASMEELVSPVGPYFLMPLKQNYVSRQTLIVRTSGPAAAISHPVLQLIRQIDSAVPVSNVSTLSHNLDGITGFLLFRLGAGLATGLGVLGFLLAVVGLYGVISYSTAQRRREIGIRIAVGGQPRRVLLTMLREGLVIVGCGVVSGIAVAALIARLAGAFLVGVSAFDPLTYISIATLLTAVALMASAIPARRATRVDPAIVLRQE